MSFCVTKHTKQESFSKKKKKKEKKKEKHLLAFSGLHGHVTQDLPPSIAVVKSQQLDLL